MDAQPKWRQDFPIDWPQDVYVARRDFTKFLGLTSLAFVVGQFTIALRNLWRRGRGLPEIRRIDGADRLQVGESLVFDYPDDSEPCLLLRVARDEYVAYSQKCTHLACAVVPREGQLFCPCHRGFFEVATGRPLAGPPSRPLPVVRLRVRVDGIYATGIERRTV
jgi:Rieske Fe-S protein